MKPLFLLICISVSTFVFLTMPSAAVACSCGGNGSVENSFSRTANIAILKVQGVEKYLEGETGYRDGRVKQSKLVVEQSFKGSLKPGQVLTFAQGQGGSADCIWEFSEESVGREFLLYLEAPGKDGRWRATLCTRSGSIERRALDIRYLRERDKRLGKTRVSGTLYQRIDTAVEGGNFQYLPLQKRKVSISGNGRSFETMSDEGGNYEFYDLDPGKYTLNTETVPGYYPWNRLDGQESVTIDVLPRGMVEKDFDFVISNRIRGIFYDSGGRALKDVCLRLRPAAGKEVPIFYKGTCTDSNGAFELERIPAGSYVLVVNEGGRISASEPFSQFYYPAAAEREKAMEISIGPGQYIDDLVVNAPSTAETVTIMGRLLLSDGKPATDKNTEHVSIEFFDDADMEKQAGRDYKEESSRAQLGPDGSFTIRILKGGKGKLVASMTVYERKYVACPVLEKLIKEKGKATFAAAVSNDIRLEAKEDLIGQELVLPFPSTCKKAIPR